MISAVNGSTAPISPANNRQDTPAANNRIEPAPTQTEASQEQGNTVTAQATPSSNGTDRQQEFREQENAERQNPEPASAATTPSTTPEPSPASSAPASNSTPQQAPQVAVSQQQNALQQQLEQVGRPEREPNFEAQA